MSIIIKRINPSIATVFVVAILLFFTSCKDEKKEIVNIPFNVETMPSMNTDSVKALISDSGYVRCRLTAKTWQIFEKAKDPKWFFPRGFFIEQLDTLGNVSASAKSDTAWQFIQRKIWKLKGHVLVINAKGEMFKGDELYWDMRKHQIYSDKYVEIIRPDKMVLPGLYGFESNETMTSYHLRKTRNGEIEVSDSAPTSPSDSTRVK